MASNLLGNPYVSPANQTVLSNITNGNYSALSAIQQATQGAAGGAAGIGFGLGAALVAAGITSAGTNGVLGTSIDSFVAGSSPYFNQQGPPRITTSGLIDRNAALNNNSDPENAVAQSQLETNGGSSFVYPEDLGAYYVSIDFFKYTRDTVFANTYINPLGTVTLPLPDGSGITDHTNVRWLQTDLNVPGLALEGITTADKLKADFNNDPQKTIGGYTTDAMKVAVDRLAAQVNPDIANAAEAGLGQTLNPAMAMLFKGVSFRQFTFSWLFSPKNAGESATLQNIIAYFKYNQLPTFNGAGTNFIFNYPNIIKPRFSSNCEPYLTNAFKYACVTDVNVDYSPVNSIPSFYSASKAPTFIRLSIAFTEMQYLLATDFFNQVGGQGSE